MNPAVFASLPTTCTAGTEGSNGPDRLTQFTYDGAYRLTNVVSAVSTDVQ